MAEQQAKGKMLEFSKKAGDDGTHHRYENKGKTYYKFVCKMELDNGDVVQGERDSLSMSPDNSAWLLHKPLTFTINEDKHAIGGKKFKGVKAVEDQNKPQSNDSPPTIPGAPTREAKYTEDPGKQAIIAGQSSVDNAVELISALPKETVQKWIDNNELTKNIDIFSAHFIDLYIKNAKKYLDAKSK